MDNDLPQKYLLSPSMNVVDVLTVLRVDETPLLETGHAVGLSIMALVILIIGIFVQVSLMLLVQCVSGI